MANFVWSQIVHKGGFHIQLYVKYVLYGLIKYVAWFSKGGKCGCFVIINKWRFWVQSTLHPIWLYMQSRSDANFNTLTKASFYDLSILPSVNSMLIIRRSLFSLQNQYIVFWWHWNEPNPTSFWLYFCSFGNFKSNKTDYGLLWDQNLEWLEVKVTTVTTKLHFLRPNFWPLL